jgi:hypothetical protein
MEDSIPYKVFALRDEDAEKEYQDNKEVVVKYINGNQCTYVILGDLLWYVTKHITHSKVDTLLLLKRMIKDGSIIACVVISPLGDREFIVYTAGTQFAQLESLPE